MIGYNAAHQIGADYPSGSQHLFIFPQNYHFRLRNINHINIDAMKSTKYYYSLDDFIEKSKIELQEYTAKISEELNNYIVEQTKQIETRKLAIEKAQTIGYSSIIVYPTTEAPEGYRVGEVYGVVAGVQIKLGHVDVCNFSRDINNTMNFDFETSCGRPGIHIWSDKGNLMYTESMNLTLKVIPKE